MIDTLIRRPQRTELPRCPWDIQEVVELWARESDRHAKVFFVPNAGWMARISLKSDDERMISFQQGLAEEPPTEDIWFHEPVQGGRPGDYEPLDILQMGASGVREFLERGNTWSGRGEYRSLEEQLQQVRAGNLAAKESFRAKKKEDSRKRQMAKRRNRLGIPLLRGADLTKEEAP